MMNVTKLACDYLVIGAGAASMSFIDTLLTEQPNAKVVLVDKYAAPGGHWNHAYGFVKLHQPSLLYGIASRQLEGSWLKLMLGKFTLPWNHRASKDELLRHYHSFIQDKIATGQIEYFPNCQYNFDNKINDHEEPVPTEKANKMHSFTSLDGTNQYQVEVKNKLVNGVLGECIVPSQTPVTFPVHGNITMMTPNQVFDQHLNDDKTTLTNYKDKHFVVLGCGKTAMDTVVYLQRSMKVRPEQISWVIPNDVWMLLREGGGNPWSWPEALLEHSGDERQACLDLERRGIFVRIDTTVEPTRFRFPVVGRDELKYMRRVTNLIRKGRVTAIQQQKAPPQQQQQGSSQEDTSPVGTDQEVVVVEFGPEQEPWIPTIGDSNDLIFVNCTSPGPFNGHVDKTLFVNEQQMNLNLLFAPPVPISMSVLAYMESARMNGTLDVDFGRTLLQSLEETEVPPPEQAQPIKSSSSAKETMSDVEVLKRLITAMPLEPTPGKPAAQAELHSILNLALVLAISDKDPMVPYRWMSGNRLSFFSIPGFKCGIYETLGRMSADATLLGYSKEETRMFDLLRERLQVLKGK